MTVKTLNGTGRSYIFVCLHVLVLALTLSASQESAQTTGLGAILHAIEDPYPLRSADTSSPRDAFWTYVRDINTPVEAWRNDKPSEEIERMLLRAADTFDSSAITEFDRSTTIVIKMILLKEILDRVALPRFGSIPDNEQVARDGIVRWTIPNTKIEIARIAERPDAGEFLFTEETVDNLNDNYAMARNLPYKAGASVGLYNEYISTPGLWISKDFPDTLPDWAQAVIFGQGVWQWISGLLLLVVSGFLIWIAYRLGA